MSAVTVLVMAKAPGATEVKTRLAPLLDRGERARLQEALVRVTGGWAHAVAAGRVFVACEPGDAIAPLRPLLPPGAHLFAQEGGDLGARLAAATARVFVETDGPLLVVGTDQPLLSPADGADAAAALRRADVVLGPALDGGYYLIGLRRPAPALFDLPVTTWGGPGVLEATVTAARGAGLTVATLALARDLDTPDDGRALLREPGLPADVTALLGPRVAVVVPTLNEAAALPACLDAVKAAGGRARVVVVDGGSEDGTPEIARGHPVGAEVVATARGRARQLNAGAREADGDAILFLHADTLLPGDAFASIARALADPAVVGGNFRLRFDRPDAVSRALERVYATQRRLGIYYGDSAIFIRRDAFEALGGFRDLPIMEDYDFARRLRTLGETVCLPGPAITSGRRWRRLGAPRTITTWIAIQGLFMAGVSPHRLARLYPEVRS